MFKKLLILFGTATALMGTASETVSADSTQNYAEKYLLSQSRQLKVASTLETELKSKLGGNRLYPFPSKTISVYVDSSAKNTIKYVKSAIKTYNSNKDIGLHLYLTDAPQTEQQIRVYVTDMEAGTNGIEKANAYFDTTYVDTDGSSKTNTFMRNNTVCLSRRVFSKENDFYRRTIAVHEIGHALGLYHSSVKKDIMYPIGALKGQKLTSRDWKLLKNLYDE